MKIGLAQTQPVMGDIGQNVERHIMLINMAVNEKADIIVFSELSLTGYEPTWAAALQMQVDDVRFQVFQNLSNEYKLTICVGAPTKTEQGLCIGMIVFQPHTQRQLYTKKYIHADEEPFFVAGVGSDVLSDRNIALAICYELSIPTHLDHALEKGASIYLASVAKTAGNIGKAHTRLQQIAADKQMQVLMVNAVGKADGTICIGRSAVWSRDGELVRQMDDVSEGILLFDTETQASEIRFLNG